MSNLFNKLEKSIEEEQSKHPIMSLRKAYISEIIPSFILVFVYIMINVTSISNTIVHNILTFILYLISVGLCMYMLHIEVDFKKEVQDELVQETFSKMRKCTLNIIMVLGFILLFVSMFANGLIVPSFTITPEMILSVFFFINAIWKTAFLILDKNETITENEE